MKFIDKVKVFIVFSLWLLVYGLIVLAEKASKVINKVHRKLNKLS